MQFTNNLIQFLKNRKPKRKKADLAIFLGSFVRYTNAFSIVRKIIEKALVLHVITFISKK